MSYLQYFGLKTEPFSNAPVTSFYYESDQHAAALMRLRYAVEQMKGLALLIGNIGAGKTTLARRLLDSLPENQFEAALLVIIHSGITSTWLLQRIALQLGIDKPAEEKIALLSQLYRRLLQIHKEGRKAVVLIDEAQMLQSKELMEEFRGMLNLEIPEKKLLTFVFFGLPEIEQNLKLDPPLEQRVAFKCRLEAFDLNATRQYIQHRLKLAGANKNIFTNQAIEIIHNRARGFPRLINTIADNALFEASLANKAGVDEVVVEQALKNLGLDVSAAVAKPSSTQSQPVAAAKPEAVPEPYIELEPMIEIEVTNADQLSQQSHKAPITVPQAQVPMAHVPTAQVLPIRPVSKNDSKAILLPEDDDLSLHREVTTVATAPPTANPGGPPLSQPKISEAEDKEYEEVFERLTGDGSDDIDAILDNLVDKKTR